MKRTGALHLSSDIAAAVMREKTEEKEMAFYLS